MKIKKTIILEKAIKEMQAKKINQIFKIQYNFKVKTINRQDLLVLIIINKKLDNQYLMRLIHRIVIYKQIK
jgi:hypothetical protein